MTYPQFFLYLAITTAVAAGLAALAHSFLSISFAWPLTVGIIVLMCLISVALFFLGKRTAGAENKFLFSNVFMGATMIKMFACGGIIAAYIFLAKPPGKFFIVPFFTTYFTFTLLEIIFLVILAREGKDDPVETA
ncbi:hypothetical protein [Lewinella sp. 4G2]|uniref:hypothetical protein n=1 Tax=Lewinella sp. 4G2 TaxID=1803372 RepID=UPI0007B4E87C|nr:hypothetical protein [Lewinella sp. 4G2]OAV42717.1 hypothetical protein A3850_015875 [Lewinella sp. 4G2]